MTPTMGRIVHYTLSDQDAAEINRRRTNSYSVSSRVESGIWPLGAQAHIGNDVRPGDRFPAMVVRVWTGSLCNLQVFLDGNDTFWATSRYEASVGREPGHWHWPTGEE